jgi:hypothetical protein
MIINRNLLCRSLLVVSLTFISVISLAQGQVCKDSYNNALRFYNSGQYENINNYVNGCIDNIKNANNHNYYTNTTNGQVILFKVYKICINSYRNLEQGNLAEQKLIELKLYLDWSREAVERRLNATPLTPIEEL